LAKKRELVREKRSQWAKEVTEKVADLVITVEEDATQEGHLYGSVDAKKIVEHANKYGLNLKVPDVILPHGLKEIGEHEVQLDLTSDYKATLKINIVKKST
jgi:large subunit ribosomal protein L9